MDPDNFSYLGYLMLIVGFALTGYGAISLGQLYSCLANASTCSATDALKGVAYSLPLLALGSYFILTGALFMAAAHITQHLRPVDEKDSEVSGKTAPSAANRVCLKCGRIVDPSASFCPNCGNALIQTK